MMMHTKYLMEIFTTVLPFFVVITVFLVGEYYRRNVDFKLLGKVD